MTRDGVNELKIPFNKPYMTGKELDYISEASFGSILSGDGPFTRRCHEWLEKKSGSDKVLLTHSCTAALEMAALLLNIQPGDEIIMPSFTFVSTANAFVLRGGVPVFVDIRRDTLNLDERLIESAITKRTKVIVPVHYAGIACDMDAIMTIANCHGLRVVEDSAQGIMSFYKGRQLGSIGDLGTFSFHETKNIICGEGGALLVNSPELVKKAEIIREKGTDRSRFFRGEIDKYTWQEMGSSFLPGDLTAAFLWGQLQEAENITHRRLALWNYYHQGLEALEIRGLLSRPIIPAWCSHNAHMYYVLLEEGFSREKVIKYLNNYGINAISHYVPLHSSPAGRRFGRLSSPLIITDSTARQLVRLPLWIGLSGSKQNFVIDILVKALLL